MKPVRVCSDRDYALDRRVSSVNSTVMQHPDGDKIVIARNDTSGARFYFSVCDERENVTCPPKTDPHVKLE